MQKRSIDLMVGLFVLLGFLALVFLTLKAANLGSFTGGATYSLVANFDNIGGLKPRAPIKSAGVVVGRVGGITFDQKRFQAEVTLDMDQRFRFPKDSSVKILTSGLLGEQYVGIDPGGDTEDFAAGDHVSMTQSAVVLENLIGQFLYGKAAEGGEGGGGGAK